MKKFGLLVFAFFCVHIATTQTFENNREKFLKKFKKSIEENSSTNFGDFIEEELSPAILNQTVFSDNHFNRLVNTSNSIIDKRHSIFPDLYNYVFSVYSLLTNEKSKSSYTAWHESVDAVLEQRNPRRFKDFIEISGDFFTSNIIAKDANFIWTCEGGEYNFTYDKSPFIEFNNTTLVCKTLNRDRRSSNAYTDSVIVKNTSGTVNLARDQWDGKGGIIYWEKVGLPKNETFARLGKYNLSLRSTSFSCDSAWVTTPYFDKEIMGKVNDIAKKGASNQGAALPYPNFHSYKANFEIPNLVDGVKYKGGFALEGNEFVGIENNGVKAQLTFLKEGNPIVTTFSEQVRITDKQLRISDGKVNIKLGQSDSISHIGLNVVYEIDEKLIQFTRGTSGMSQAPFVNSYHKLDMYVEQIVWNTTSNQIKLGYNFSTAKQRRTAKFESFDYYDERLWQELNGMSSVHPLLAIYDYAYKYDKFTMKEGDAANALQATISQAKPRLLDLAKQGFLSYDIEKGTLKVTQKTIHFVKANLGKGEFDNISFTSDLTPIRLDQFDRELSPEQKQIIAEQNAKRTSLDRFASIDLNTLEMDIEAVDRVTISETNKTLIFPDDDFITVKKNRSIVFEGWINSGRWEVNISEGFYDYDKHSFNIAHSKQAFFRAIPLKEEHGERLIPLQSVIEDLKGELLVDAPENRSGLNKSNNDYPKLISKEKTKVYYDNKGIQKGAYDRQRFYFEVDPFTVDSLLTFNDLSQRFSGKLVSSGIFPAIDDSLKLMPDYSLGFSQKAPKSGYVFYETAATYNNQILLSNSGLQGAGTIEFINSTSQSKSLFTFLPDSTIGVVEFVNRPQEQGVQYPDANCSDAFLTFIPREGVLKARSNKELISFFNDESKLKGTTTIQKSGMRANGQMEFKGALMYSDDYKLSRWDMDVKQSSFQIKNIFSDDEELSENPLVMKTDNVRGNINFKKRKGVFKSNEGTSIIDLPVNQYICKVDQFSWLMDDNEMPFETKGSDNLSSEVNDNKPNFFSTHPDQDSLKFNAPVARYDIKNKVIYCSETEYIEVADARIFPDSMKVTIRKDAEMDPFENAEIIANFTTKHHKIDKVKAKISSQTSYSAEGYYDYSSGDGKTYSIFLEEIKVDDALQTVAIGKISKEENFKLSPEFDFYGTINLEADSPELIFDGATRINHECDKFSRNWMAFKAKLDKKNIQIPVSENMKDLNGNSISAGIVWRNSSVTDSVRLYPTFLSTMEDKDDPIVITSSGYLQYNTQMKEYQIGSKEKLSDKTAPGTFISLSTSTCSLHGYGKVDLGMDYGPSFKTEAVGVVNYNQETGKTNLNITLSIEAPLEDKIFEDVADKINDVPGLNNINLASTSLEQALVEWVDQETADKIKSDLNSNKEIKNMPRSLRNKIVLTGLQLVSYDKLRDPQRGLKSITDQAVVVSIYGKPVLKYASVKLFAEQRVAFGDRLGLLIDIPGSSLYFFDYDYRKKGVLNILSNDVKLNDAIDNLNADKKRAKDFTYQTTRNSAFKSQFLRVFN
jgi:hypothetical protein